ncbi:MAG: hypothetical protein IJH65_16875 [Methanobrevibacter sp.]|nr:hypothetical protein [Methanobrevibacter sp.]
MKNNEYILISPENQIKKFIEENENTREILEAITPQLKKHFPNSKLSLEICNSLTWTTETKLLVNVNVSEEMFFNEMITHFNEIYETINPLIEDIFCPIVLFPDLGNDKYDKFSYDCAINLIARTSYFNSDFDKNLQREMSLRDIPKSQKEKEIIEYLNIHENVDLSDLVFDLQLDLFDVDDILDELAEKGIDLNVKY